MMEQIREGASWRKAKTSVISKYNTDHAKVMAEIAGRGFLALPGYAYDIENALELITKQGLSDINYKILSESIERELKQTKIDYDITYKNAIITWEIEKQELLINWDAELAGLKQGMESDEEVLNLLSIEVGKRSIVLLEGKTAIKVSMEGYRQTLATLDGSTAPYEVQLANAKLLTAQRKLSLIPVLQEINTKEQAILTLELSKSAAYTALMAEESALSVKRQTLAPFINQFATKVETNANEIITHQIPKEGQIADEKVKQATEHEKKSRYYVEELTKNYETEELKLDLLTKKRDLNDKQFTKAHDIRNYELDQDEDYQIDLGIQFDNLLNDEATAQKDIKEDKEEVHRINNEIRSDSSTKQIAASSKLSTFKVLENDWMVRRVAEINAAAKITAELVHIIG